MLDGNVEQSVKDMVVRGAELKIQMKAMEEELRAINHELARIATFKPGSKTGTLLESGIKVTVSLRENVKYLQDRLLQVRELLPEEFSRSFVYEFKPESSRTLESVMKENEQFAKAVSWARQVKEGAPYVTYERIEDEELPF